MAEYIEREAAINLLHYNADESCSSVVADFEALPAEDVAPVVHGRWIQTVPGDNIENHCSACGAETPWFYGYGYYESDYCPNCGAKMREAR